MSPKTLIASAQKPAAPVTLTWSPSPRSWCASARMSVDGVEERVGVVAGSLDRRDDEQRLAVLATGSARWTPPSGRSGWRSASRSAAAASLLVGRPERLAVALDHRHRGRDLALRELLDLSATATDSAPPGRNDEVSFFCAFSNLPAYEPATNATSSNTAKTTHLRAAAGRDGQEAGHGEGAPVTGKGGVTTQHTGRRAMGDGRTHRRSRRAAARANSARASSCPAAGSATC